MLKAVSRACALVAITVSTLAAAQDYQDSTPYVVDTAKYPYTIYPQSTVLDNNVPWETTVLPFDHSATYTAPEQDAVVNGESTLLNAPVFIDFDDGMRDVDFAQATIPEANTPNVPPATETGPSSLRAGLIGKAAATPVTNTYQRTERFGNSMFGAGYTITASATATPANGAVAKKSEAVAEGKVLGTAFTYEKELVRGRAQVCGQAGGCNTGALSLYAMGSLIWNGNFTGSFSMTPINWSRSFFSVSKTFMVGPVPLTVRAQLTGGVKMGMSGQVGPLVASLNGYAGGNANVVASAGVGISIASFGVSGTLTLINATASASPSLSWNSCSPTVHLGASINTNALSGNLKAYATIKFLFFKKTWDVTIATWSGISRNTTLINYTATIPVVSC